jgi:hypothetical protein
MLRSRVLRSTLAALALTASIGAPLAGCSDTGGSTSIGNGLGADGATASDDGSTPADATGVQGASDGSLVADALTTSTDAATVSAMDATPVVVDATMPQGDAADATAQEASSDAVADAVAESGTDAPADGPGDAIADAIADVMEELVPNPDGGCAFGDNPCACNTFLVANQDSGPYSTTCSATEVVLFAKDGSGACLDCAIVKGCIDGAGYPGFECHDALDGGVGSADETECLATLACDIGQYPVASPGPAKGIATVAFCGMGVSNSACNTDPQGVCKAQWLAGFPGETNSDIQSNPGKNTLPSGVANTIVGCLNQNCPQFCL